MALVSRWVLDSEATDETNTNNGTASDVTYVTTDKRQGSGCASFNGSSSSITVDGLDPYDNTNYTFTWWFKSTTTSNTQSMLELAQSDSDNNRWAVRFSSGTWLFYVNSGGVALVNEDGVAIIQDSKWHHIAYVDANGVWSIYVDGVLDGSGSYTRFSDDNQRFTFGKLRFNAYSGYFLNGKMDDIRYYNTALSQGEVTALYNATKPPTWENYVSRWTLDNTANDYCGVNNGTATDITYQTSPKVSGYSALYNASNTSTITLADTNGVLFGAGDATVSMWIKTTATSAGKGLFANYDNKNTPAFFIFRISNTNVKRISLFIYDSGADGVLSEGTIDVNDGKWHHVVGIRNGQTVTTYVDGKLDGTATGANVGSTDSTRDFRIGGYDYWSGSEYLSFNWNGSIDDVRMWKQALTAAEVRGLYNSYFQDNKFFGGSNV